MVFLNILIVVLRRGYAQSIMTTPSLQAIRERMIDFRTVCGMGRGEVGLTADTGTQTSLTVSHP